MSYDYVLNIDLSQFPDISSTNDLFNIRSYTINTSGNSADLQINQTLVTSLLTYDYNKNKQNGIINYDPGNNDVINNPDYQTLSPNPSKFGYRMLEIIATKIFGNAEDLVLVENGSAFYQTGTNSLISQISNDIQNNFNNSIIQNNVLNIYKNSSSFISTEGTYNFNFMNSTWQFPLYYNDTVKFVDGSNSSSFNGPDAGGSKIINGYINVPILLKFYSTPAALIPPSILLKAVNYSGSGAWLDESGSGKNATKTAGTIAKNIAGNGIILDGSTYWTFPDVGLGNAWTINLWYKNTGTATGDGASVITQQYDTGSPPYYFTSIGYNNDVPGQFSIAFYNAGYQHGADFSSTITANLNNWLNIQGTWNGTTLSTYINANLIDATNISFESINNGLSWFIGRRREDFAEYVVGEIGEVRIYNYAINQAKVTTDYKNSITTYIWQPTAITGCLLWLDANDQTSFIMNGSSVSQWSDKSGSANNMTQSTAGSQPTLTINNGMNFVNTGSGAFLVNSTMVFPAAPYSIFAVAVNNINSGDHNVLIELYTDSHLLFGSFNGNYKTLVGNGDWNDTNTNSPATSVTSLSLMEMINSGGSTTLIPYINGTALDAKNGICTSATGIVIGRFSPTISQWEWKGYIGEILIYNSDLTTTKRQVVEGYLAWKWNLQASLPAGHPFLNNPPVYNESTT